MRDIYQLQQDETLAEIRKLSPQLATLSDDTLKAAYSSWSQQMFSASWMIANDSRVKMFVDWAVTPPIQGFLCPTSNKE